MPQEPPTERPPAPLHDFLLPQVQLQVRVVGQPAVAAPAAPSSRS